MFQLANVANLLDDTPRAALAYEQLLPFAEQFVVYGEAMLSAR